MKFSEIFAAFGSNWPRELVNTSWPPTGSPASLLALIDNILVVHGVVADVGPDGTLAVTGVLKLAHPELAPSTVPMVSGLFPSFTFTFAGEGDWSSPFRMSIAGTTTFTVQVDNLPLGVGLPADLLAAHPVEAQRGADTDIDLTEGANQSVIKRNFAFTLEASGAARLEPHLPISIGPCRLFGIPMRAVHELVFLGAPGRADDLYDWVVRPIDPSAFVSAGGGLGFGGLELDFDVPDTALADLRSRLHLHPEAKVVVEDLIIPAIFPVVPQHGSGGLRKSLDPGESIGDYLSFTDAPLRLPLGEHASLFLNQLFFKTPPREQSLVTGLSISGGIAFGVGEPGEPHWEVEIALVNGDILTVSIARLPAGEPPAPSGNAEEAAADAAALARYRSHRAASDAEQIPMLRLDMFGYLVDFFGIRAGVSLKALQQPTIDPGAAIVALLDIFIHKKTPTQSTSSESVGVVTEDGSPFEMALTDLGWMAGTVSGNIVLPKGTALVLAVFRLEIYEMGLASELGATYFSISGGIRLTTSSFEGAAWFTRLRVKLSGNPDAPPFQLAGVGAELKIAQVVEISIHGSFRNDLLPDGTRIKEHGFGGSIKIFAGGNEWGLSVDVFWGERIPVTEPRIDYLLFMVTLFGAIPMGPLELRQIESLYANALLPKLDTGDRAAGELKYYSWLKRARPTALPETRGLDAWTPTQDAWAFGLGLGVSFSGAGSVLLLTAFGLGFESPDAAGLIIALELKLFGGKKPIAIGILEYDFKRDAFVVQIQLDISLDQLIENFPRRLKVKLGGTIVIGNKPGLIAFGRLADMDTWIGARISIELSSVVRLEIRIALCFEWLENTYVGGGFIFSIAARADLGVVRLEGWGALKVLLRFMTSGTNDYVARITFEAGFALVVLRFWRMGLTLLLEAEWLAHTPDFFRFTMTVRIDLGWFLPTVSFTIESITGSVEPAARGVTSSPLLQASGEARSGSRRARVLRADGLAGAAQPDLLSVDQLRTLSGAWQGTADPLPLDARVEIVFSNVVVDALGIGNVDPDLAVQRSGDGQMELSSRYVLTGIEVRRRPLASDVWETVESLTSAASPRAFRWLWEADMRSGGVTLPKKLIFNGKTPFSVGTDNPVADAEILTENPGFPCCLPQPPDIAHCDFGAEPPGPLPNGMVRNLRFERRGSVAPIKLYGEACVVGGPISAGAQNALVSTFTNGHRPIMLAATEDLAVASLHLASNGKGKLRIVVEAFNVDGKSVFSKVQVTGGSPAYAEVKIDPHSPFRRVHVTLAELGNEQQSAPVPSLLSLDFVECITSDDMARWERDQARCQRETTDGHAPVVNLLARHEYEITLTTTVSVKHSSTNWESAVVLEKVGFVTAGPPGLNETPEPGLELVPYVVSAPPGGRGALYREESVNLVLSDDVRILGPGTGSSEATFRLPVVLALESSFDSMPAKSVAKGSHASQEWFLAHRGLHDTRFSVTEYKLVRARSNDPFARRYQQLSETSTGTCAPDDVWNEQQPRLGIAPFDAQGRPLWDSRGHYRAVMRLAGSPLVDRNPFEAADLAAFTSQTGAWSLVDNRLVATSAATARFGNPDWDFTHLELAGEIGLGGGISATVLIAPAAANNAITFTLERHGDGTGRLAAFSGGGMQIETADVATMSDTSGLIVDTFADAVRARCGEVVISVPRRNRTAGGCGIGGVAVRIASLKVTGIEMMALDFTASRYESFRAHIASCKGAEPVTIASGAESVPALRARVGSRIAAAMNIAATDSEREATFAEVSQALAIPLREDPDRLFLDIGQSGTDRWLLIESPEPIDFVAEVRLALQRRSTHPTLDGHETVRLGPLIEAALHKPVWRPVFVRLPKGLGFEWPQRRGLGGREMAAFKVGIQGAFFVVTDLATRVVRRVLATSLSQADRASLHGTLVYLDKFGHIVAWDIPDEVEWVDVVVDVIQNGNGTKALLLPGAGVDLLDGPHRLDLRITRSWFETLAPQGTDNSYIDQAEIVFNIGHS